MKDLSELYAMLGSTSAVRMVRGGASVDAPDLPALIEPHFGEVTWVPPADYRSCLATWGNLAVEREIPRIGISKGFAMLGPDEIQSVNQDLVHLPEGVSRGAASLTTNHLVGFATSGDEGVWCFDVSQADANGNYPVYYHHQDEPRVRTLPSLAWENEDDAQPDFQNFTHWLSTMVDALCAPELPAWFENLGSPYLRFGRG